MKKMKSITVWMLAVSMTVLLAACGSGAKDTAQVDSSSKAEASVTETSETEEPGSKESGTETTEAETPETEEPGSKESGTETTEAETPETEESGSKESGTETAEAETPETEESGTETAEAETPETEESGTESPADETSGAEAAADAELIEEEVLAEVLDEAEQYSMEDLAGEYNAFAATYMGYTYSIEEAGSSSRMTLLADGTGTIEFDDEQSDIPVWAVEGNILTLSDETGFSAEGTVTHGVIVLDFLGDGSTLAYYAKDGADTSWLEIMTMEEIKELIANGPGTKTYDTCSAIDTSAGVHLAYELHTDYMDADMIYEVNAKDGVYASSRTTHVSDLESTTITFYKDGKVYNLDPSDMTGMFVTETSILEDNLVGMDSLYQKLSSFCRSTSYTEETREYEGASYTVEVYPEGKYNAETAFYYDAEGTLAFIEVKAYTTESGTEVPASFYTIHAIDTNVDEAALDMSAYTVEEAEEADE